MTSALLSLPMIAGLLLGQYAPQRLAGDPLPEPQEARVQVLAKNLRCAVCQGLSVADSPSSMARAQLEVVRELVSEGKSDEEVVQYFVSRYGEWVLLEPEVHGVNLIVWAGPLVLVALGLTLIFRQVGPKRQAATAAGPPDPGAEEDPYLKAVRAETER
jgi:cytochrome c-type biogenesis protein CcmH